MHMRSRYFTNLALAELFNEHSERMRNIYKLQATVWG